MSLKLLLDWKINGIEVYLFISHSHNGFTNFLLRKIHTLHFRKSEHSNLMVTSFDQTQIEIFSKWPIVCLETETVKSWSPKMVLVCTRCSRTWYFVPHLSLHTSQSALSRSCLVPVSNWHIIFFVDDDFNLTTFYNLFLCLHKIW